MNHSPKRSTPLLNSPDSIVLSPASGSNFSNPSCSIMQPYNGSSNDLVKGLQPCLQIVEEPVDKCRFRYKTELVGIGTQGSLNGINSRIGKRTAPSVQLLNYNKAAVIRCTLYQHGREGIEYTYHPHAHNLVKHDGPNEINDPHNIEVNTETGYVANFHNMYIICTPRKKIMMELVRKHMLLKQEKIAQTEHNFRDLTEKEENEVKAIAEMESYSDNLNIVCLLFDAFKVINGIFYPLCSPIYSTAVSNSRSISTGNLKIVRMDHPMSPTCGGKEIFILVEKVNKLNIKVRFYEVDDEDKEVWSAFARFNDTDVHHQYAIVCKTPPYKTHDIDHKVQVFIELYRPSDGARSESRLFTYTPHKHKPGKKRAQCSLSSDQQYQVDHNVDVNMDIGTLVVDTDDLEAALKQDTINSPKELSNKKANGEKRDQSFAEGHEEHLQGITIKKRSLGDQEVVKKVQSELISLMKTNPTKEKISAMLQHLFLNKDYVSDNGDTVLHLLVSKNNAKNDFLNLLLIVLVEYQQTNLINICNKRGRTALHLAITCCNIEAVERLMYTKADVSIQDLQGNTALHGAVVKGVPVNILKLLFMSSDVKKYIDLENYDGHTALHVAVKADNLPATMLLCRNQANVNAEDKKNGYTVLHIAVVDRHLEIVQFLLQRTDIKCDKQDHGQNNALNLAKMLIRDDLPRTKEIYQMLENFMLYEEISIEEKVRIKEDIVEMIDEELKEIKDESMSPDSLKCNYNKLANFPKEYLNEICSLLDKSGNWHNLATLLDYDYLLKTGLFETLERPSKTLLDLAIIKGESLLVIRNLLESLDELKVVQIIDTVVKGESKNY